MAGEHRFLTPLEPRTHFSAADGAGPGPVLVEATPAIIGESLPPPGPQTAPTDLAFQSASVSPAALSVPPLSSRPGARAKLYLDFDGDTTPSWGSFSPGVTPAYDTDGDAATFSAAELDGIRQIWARVAEKFSPFDLDVTTVDPVNYADGQALRLVVGGSGNWRGAVSGGATYVGGFADPATPNTGYVFEDNLGNGNPLYTAEAAASQAGFGFGLRTQAVYDSAGQLVSPRNEGDARRAPVMGTSYYSERGLWWYGTTSSATTYQDDLALLAGAANGFGYRPDDRGNAAASATTLTASGSSLYGSGVIEQAADADWFSFTNTAGAAGALGVTVSPAPDGPMLDAKVELRSAAGTLLASADTSSLGEMVAANVAAGTYYVVVKSHGAYGDVGQYTIAGTFTPGGVAPAASAGGPYTADAGGGGGGVVLSAAASTGNAPSYAWDLDGDGQFGETGPAATRGDETGPRPTFVTAGVAPGTYPVYVRATDAAGLTSSAAATVRVVDTTGPTVTSVVLSGSGWSPPFLAALAAAGRGTGGGFAVPAGTAQLLPLPWSGVNQVKIQFSEPVNVTQGQLQVRGGRVASYPVAGFTYDAGTRTATWTLAQPVAGADTLTLDLNAGTGGVTDFAGNALDGEWANGGAAEQFPSGDGAPGGNFTFRVNVLPGDVNRDGRVTSLDFAQARMRLAETPTGGDGGTNAYSPFYDTDGDGRITAMDLWAVRLKMTSGLPTAALAPAGAGAGPALVNAAARVTSASALVDQAIA